jgi:hypothetical protein
MEAALRVGVTQVAPDEAVTLSQKPPEPLDENDTSFA